MDMAQWPQGFGVINVNISNTNNVVDHQADSSRAPPPTNMLERSASRSRAVSTTSITTSSATTTTTARPVQKDQALNCPRCNSSNTKFCYYNNYSLSQPRYFCKTCRRYWTEGGSLRNVPVGGGSRKNKRSSSSSSAAPAKKDVNSTDHDHDPHHHLGPPFFLHQNPRLEGDHDHDQQQGKDLNLAYPPAGDQYDLNQNQNPSSSSIMDQIMSKMNGIAASSRGLISFMPMPTSAPDSSGLIPVHEFMKPTFNFSSLDHHQHHGFERGYGPGHTHINDTHHVGQEPNIINNASARSLFPIDHENNNDIKHVQSTSTTHEQGNSTAAGYWNGSMFGAGSW